MDSWDPGTRSGCREIERPHVTVLLYRSGGQYCQIKYYDFTSGRNHIGDITLGFHPSQQRGKIHPPVIPEETCDTPILWCGDGVHTLDRPPTAATWLWAINQPGQASGKPEPPPPQVYKVSFPWDIIYFQLPFPGFPGSSYAIRGLRNHFNRIHCKGNVQILKGHPIPYPHYERCGHQVPPWHLTNRHYTTD